MMWWNPLQLVLKVDRERSIPIGRYDGGNKRVEVW